jgi:transposase-like protein
MARTSYSDETKAQVMAALLAGQSVSSVARNYNLPKGTVSSWRQQAQKKGRVESSATQKGESLDDLLLAYVQENLTTLREQAQFFRDGQWLKRQDASALAVLHGVIADKTVRLLEAFGGEPAA